jgi:uncharacterized protein (TIGR03790 family)
MLFHIQAAGNISADYILTDRGNITALFLLFIGTHIYNTGMNQGNFFRFVILMFLFNVCACFGSQAALIEAALLPEEIAVLVNKKSSESRQIGELYVNLRKIPPSNIIKVSVRISERISREEYDGDIAGPVRKSLRKIAERGGRIKCLVTTYGIPLRIAKRKPSGTPGVELEKQIAMKKRKSKELSALEKESSEDAGRKQALSGDIHKLRSEITNIRFRINHLSGRDTVAAVDSELALVLVQDYDLAGWQINPEFVGAKGSVKKFAGKTLMVSRIDAPTPELAMGLMRRAVEVEKTGLSGKFYIDARGLKGKDAYGRFDEELKRTAELMKKSKLPVVFDNRPKLFGPGEAPSAALYCGWYSLGEYIDAFEWTKGAVGYHVASSEAVSIHKKNKRYWVKSMIEKGVIATLGSVTEPYLNAFPPPSVFFQLLMSGRYSLAEVFNMSNPFISWQMILVGDPLYNPFRNRPAMNLQNAPPAPG